METAEALELAWNGYQTRQRPARGLFKKLSTAQAYQVQRGVLERFIATGERLAGWKLGANSARARQIFGPENCPFYGFLLASGAYPSGHRLNLSEVPGSPVMEYEICVTFGKRLTGPGITRTDIIDAVSGIAPAFEVAGMGRVEGLDAAQMISDNVSQWGYVIGKEIPLPKNFDIGAVKVAATKNGKPLDSGIARGNIDEQFETLAWLANQLAAVGLAIEPGQRVITGACLNPAPPAPGDSWECTFEGIGSVSVSFA
jgi:2-keto-4-pentenoate hydratase